MAIGRLMSGRPRTILGSAIVTVATVAVGTMAVAYQGNPTTEVDLHDGSVWLTKSTSLLVGHYNHESQLLDGSFRTASETFDVLQDGQNVLVTDPTESAVAPVDPASVSLGDRVDTPEGATVQSGANTVAMLEPKSGSLYVVPFAAIGSFIPAESKPVAKLGEDASVTVGTDGTVYAVSVSHGLVTVPVNAVGEPLEPNTQELEWENDASLQLTSVGRTAVVLDVESGLIQTNDGARIAVDARGDLRLAADSAQAERVVLATPVGLMSVPLDGSDVTTMATESPAAVPAEPVVVAGCSYAAWQDTRQVMRDCAGSDDDISLAVEGGEDAGELRYRTNRDVVMLNDLASGAAWVASDALQRVDNWDELTPPQDGEENQDNEDTTEETLEVAPPQRSEQNTKPIATNDRFGVRAGRTTILPVLDNDSDADGDVLSVTLPKGSPQLGEAQVIQNGGAVQVAIPEGASGTGTFEYQIDDGRGGVATASVRLDVHPDSDNAAPEQNRIIAVPVETGGTVAYNIMPDWRDPDGDEMYLVGVNAAEGDEADFTADGRITYRAISGAQGPLEVEVLVRDGELTTSGILKLDVRPAGTTTPVANADHVIVREGRQATVSPLANDISAGTEPLRLTRVDEVDGLDITPDYPDKSFTVSGNQLGTYYVSYLVSAGPSPAQGIVRVDVVEDVGSELPPVAVRDVALLPAGGEVLVGVLDNDIDPAGGVLVVQSASAPADAGLSVSVVGHEALRIADRAQLSDQVVLTYQISNGAQTAVGEVTVIPVPAPEELRAPVANDDTATVRVGDVVTIPVLANDYHPNGDEMAVVEDLAELPAEDAGIAFVSQDTVRFQASNNPGTAYLTYEVTDSAGQRDAGYVSIQVLPRDDENNSAPRPRDVTARALAGEQTIVPIPLDGLDSDGDSVELIGVLAAPRLGRIVSTESDHFVYEADASSSGMDSFTYRVRDALGAEGSATIRVGVAPAEATNQPPFAVTDSLVVRPGRIVAVPVTANDSDPEGGQIALLTDGLIMPEVEGLTARVVASRVEVTAPTTPMETSLQYTIADEFGAEAVGVLKVTVSEDVPLRKPIARDDYIKIEDIGPDGTAQVTILTNDEDPDGTTDALTLELGGGELLDANGGVVRVTVGDERQLIPYTVTDPDGLIGRAYIHVPSSTDLSPVLYNTDPVVVGSGLPVEISLADYVRAPSGRDVIITEAASVTAVHSNGGGLLVDERTLTYTSQEDYAGADSISFEVTDGSGPDDPIGNKATLSIPITVLPAANEPPMMRGTAMTVGAGDGPSMLDLVPLATDPEDDPLTFTLGGVSTDAVQVALDGTTLTATAGPDTAGTTAQVEVAVSDGENDPVVAEITVVVTSTAKPLPVAVDDTVAPWNQGETLRIDPRENDINPFPETPLEVVGATLESGDGAVTIDGNTVEITPSETFVGSLVVRYRIADVTGQEDRKVEGRITLTVRGIPGIPGKPTVSSVQDRTVVLGWTPPAANGAPITSYTVSTTDGSYTQECTTTTCTLTGLTNNVEYRFIVVAKNEVGVSEASLPSEIARPDARPDQPAPPVMTGFGDGSLTMAWETPSTPGSPVTEFTLQLSPAPPNGIAQKPKIVGNTYTWTGLQNGTAYQVQVRAHNRAPEPSTWSGWSATEIPAAPPAAPDAPTTSYLDPVGNQAQMQVSWNQPAANGDAIDSYTLDVMQGPTVVNTIPVPAGQTSQTVSVPTSTTDYTFRVLATNKAGAGPYSATSAPRRGYGAPSVPANVTAKEGDRVVEVSWAPSDGNGLNQGEFGYEYSLNGGDWSTNWAVNGTSATITAGISNGTGYTVRVRASYHDANGGPTVASDPSAPSNQVVPFGPVAAPSVSAKVGGAEGRDITFTWDPPAPNGRDITGQQIRIDSGAWEDVPASGSRTVTFAYGTSHTIVARAIDAAGQVGPSANASAKTDPAPVPTAKSGKGSKASVPGCQGPNCAQISVTVKDFKAGTYTVQCWAQGPRYNGDSRRWNENETLTMKIDANGTFDSPCVYGYDGNYVWIVIEGWGAADKFLWPKA